MIDSFDTFILKDEDMEKEWQEYLEIISDIDAHPEEKKVIRYRQLQLGFVIAKHMMVSRDDVLLSYKLHQPVYSMGSISMEAKSLEFEDNKWFPRLAWLATNTEVYPLANGSIRMTFTFHGVEKPEEERHE